DMIRERSKRRLIARQPHMKSGAVRIGALAEAQTRMRIGTRETADLALPLESVPAPHYALRSIEQRRHRLWSAQEIRQQPARDRNARLVAPLTVGVDPLEAVHPRRPLPA